MTLIGLTLFLASFMMVFFLALNSKVLRDDHILLGSIISFFITAAQYVMTWVLIHSDMGVTSYLFYAGMGGSIGTTVAQYLYKYVDKNYLPQRRLLV